MSVPSDVLLDVKNLRVDLPTENGLLHAGMLGRIAPEKGQLDFLRAARMLVEAGRNVRFSITGKSSGVNGSLRAKS